MEHHMAIANWVLKEKNPEGNEPGRTVAKAEVSILWPHDVKSQLLRKDPDPGKDWRQKEVTENEVVRQHHQFNGHAPEQTLGDSNSVL